MQAISLPLLSNQDSLHLALARLKSHERAGVVVHDGYQQFRLLHAGELLAAREAGKQFLSEVAGGESVYVIEPLEATNYKLDLVQPMRTPASYQNMLTASASEFALVGADYDTAMIVTRSEEYERALRSTGGYECNGPTKHFFPRPRVKAGDDCPLCVPGSLPGGGTPVISPSP
jgi:hypothetical protein